MTYYLGKPGALVALPDPEVGLSQTVDRLGGTHQLLSGARVRDTLGRMRTWNLSWTAINLTTFGTLQAFYDDAVGPGPYYFLDPEQRNLLTADASSGGQVTRSTAAFGTTFSSPALTLSLVGPGAFLFPDPTNYVLGAATGGAYTTPPSTQYVTMPNVPAVPSTTYTMQVVVAQTGASSPTVNAAAQMLYYDSTGTYISESDGAPSATFPQASRTVTGTTPSNVATILPRVALTASGGAVSVVLDHFQLEQAASASTWVPGQGAPLVTVESLSRSTPLAGLCDAQMTLVQVG